MHYHVIHREFLWPTSIKWVQMLIFQVHIIRNSLYIKRSSQFCVFSHIFDKFSNFTYLCHSHWMHYQVSWLMPLVQFIHCSSVEASLPWKCCLIAVWLLFNYAVTCYHMQMIASSIMGCFNFVWHLNDRNCEICAINALSSQSTEIAVLVIISIKPLVLHWTPEPQETLWH